MLCLCPTGTTEALGWRPERSCLALQLSWTNKKGYAVKSIQKAQFLARCRDVQNPRVGKMQILFPGFLKLVL